MILAIRYPCTVVVRVFREPLKQMRIKEHLDKIRLSHLLCLFCGALIPIYADVLFLHEINSSTVSAAMDTIMAIAAVSAALSVRHWLRDRVKNLGFEHAQHILLNIHKITHKYFYLKSGYEDFASKYMNGSELDESETNALRLESEALKLDCINFRTETLELYAAILGLSSWDMTCKYEENYKDYLKTLERAQIKIATKLDSLDLNSHTVRSKQWQDWKDEFSKINTGCSDTYKKLNKRFVNAFTYTPPSE